MFYVGAWVGELELDRVTAELGGATLFVAADILHLFVGEIGVGAGARRAASVGDNDAAEGLVVRVVEAIADRVVGEDLDVVLVGGDAEVGDAREGGGRIFAGGGEYVGARLRELHARNGWTTD